MPFDDTGAAALPRLTADQASVLTRVADFIGADAADVLSALHAYQADLIRQGLASPTAYPSITALTRIAACGPELLRQVRP